MPTPKWFTVATEGQTSDGREIQRSWLEDIAETYNRQKYGARIWLEHIKGILPDSPFKAYGDVLAVKLGENDEGKATLQAQIDPTPDLVALSKARQKIYTSMEIDPDFAKSGRVGLIGLGITDTPASLGTDILEFSAQHPDKNPLALRKLSPGNLFTSAIAVEMDFSDEAPAEASGDAGLLRSLAESFRKLATKSKAPSTTDFSDLANAVQAFADSYTEQQKTVIGALGDLEKKVSAIDPAAFVSVKDFKNLRDLLDATDANPSQRPPATGGNGTVLTDC